MALVSSNFNKPVTDICGPHAYKDVLAPCYMYVKLISSPTHNLMYVRKFTLRSLGGACACSAP